MVDADNLCLYCARILSTEAGDGFVLGRSLNSCCRAFKSSLRLGGVELRLATCDRVEAQLGFAMVVIHPTRYCRSLN